jgi:hypothetical protein
VRREERAGHGGVRIGPPQAKGERPKVKRGTRAELSTRRGGLPAGSQVGRRGEGEGGRPSG